MGQTVLLSANLCVTEWPTFGFSHTIQGLNGLSARPLVSPGVSVLPASMAVGRIRLPPTLAARTTARPTRFWRKKPGAAAPGGQPCCQSRPSFATTQVFFGDDRLLGDQREYPMALLTSLGADSQKPVLCAIGVCLRPNGQFCWRSGQPCWQSTILRNIGKIEHEKRVVRFEIAKL
jgi:hypothetical protein